MDALPPVPALSDALLKALDARFPDALPRISGPSQGLDLEDLGKSVLRTIGHREVIDFLAGERAKQKQE